MSEIAGEDGNMVSALMMEATPRELGAAPPAPGALGEEVVDLVSAEERHAYLVRLAMEACAPYIDEGEERVAERIRERMAQAAQVWTSEVEPAPERVYTRAEVLRRASIAWERVMGNGTTAHEMFLASMKRSLEPVDAEVLSSCPFCGGAALEIRDGLGTSRCCYVWCRTCGADGPSEITGEEAAKHSWNRRP